MAETTGLSPRSLTKILTGNQILESTADRFAAAIGRPTDELFDLRHDMCPLAEGNI